MATIQFKDSKVDLDKLVKFGFVKNGAVYEYQQPIVNNQFLIKITVNTDGDLETQVIDSETKAEYVLHLQPGATGKFVTKVANEYQAVLNKIQAACYEKDVFKEPQVRDIIDYINDTYDSQLEFLWKKFPHNAIWRRGDTNKWFGLLSVIPKSKLGLDSEKTVTVMDMRADSELIDKIVDNQKFFPGYHMSKHNWFTIMLDGTVDNQEIFDRLQASYNLAK